MRADTQTQNLLTLLFDGPMSAAKLRDALDISPPTLSRLINRLGPEVVTLGKARATHYARPRDVRGGGSQFPVYRIDDAGDMHRHGDLIALWGNSFWWQPIMGHGRVYRDLPWFIQDMKPDGFVGRAFAQHFGPILGISPRLPDWNNDHILIALSRFGNDAVGNLIIGEESLRRYLDNARQKLVLSTRDDYPQLAESALAGDPAGSSVGGEQPKFTALIELNGQLHQVLVKFSPRVSTEEGERWSDLLVCEHLAHEIIRESGHSVVTSSIQQIDGRTFLEVERFDRVGQIGRLPVNSLGVVDDEYFAYRDNWTAMARRLLQKKMMATDDCVALVWLDMFGELIANTDRHFGNISVVPVDASKTFIRLAPSYDMLPMFYRPRANEEFVTTVYSPKAIIADIPGELESALQSALEFWLRATADDRISAGFRQICSNNQQKLMTFMQGPKLV